MLCQYDKCPLKDTCQRYQWGLENRTHPWQPWLLLEKIEQEFGGGEGCNQYWKIKEK
jgi:hypothetical protein